MATDKQIEAARNNGALSHGPVTPEGKEASSRNARKHGLSSKKFIFEQEDAEAFEQLLADYRVRFQPADRVEDDLVLELAINRLRMELVWTLRVSTFDLESARQDTLLSTQVRNPDSELILSSAFRHLASTGQVDAYSRFESHFSRMYNRALRSLRELQRDRKQASPAISLNEPAVQNEPAPQTDTPPAQNEPGAPKHAQLQNEPAATPRLYSINDLIARGYVPSLRSGPVKRPATPGPDTSNTTPPAGKEDAA